MTRRLPLVAFAALLAVGFALPLRAQRAGVVLALPASARAAGVADAAPLATGAGALFYGAQRLPERTAAAASAGAWIGGAQLSSFAVSMPARHQFAVAAGVQSLDYGSTEEIVPDPLTGGARGTPTGGRVGASELAATLGARGTFAALRAGVTVAYVHQQVADLSASTIAAGGGVGVDWNGWGVDAALQHAGRELTLGATSSSLVTTTRAAVLSPAMPAGATSWRGVAEWRSVQGEDATALLGAEGSWRGPVGWELQGRAAATSHATGSARDAWSAGGSAARGGWSLDYAYQGFGALGAVHRMGVTWHSRAVGAPSR